MFYISSDHVNSWMVENLEDSRYAIWSQFFDKGHDNIILSMFL